MHEFNILCLGQTGSGKTTTLASLPSCIQFSSWDEAKTAKNLQILSKVKFTLTNDKVRPINVDLGNDDNENHENASYSCTQKPKIHRIKFENCGYNFVDVPGSGDTRGIEQDSKNGALILEAIRNLDQIHMVLIFMKSNEARLTPFFKHCINESLTKLHIENIHQIGFVLTYGRNTQFNGGDGVQTLKAHFEELQRNRNICVKVQKINTYVIDNEAFRIVCALQNDPEFKKRINLETFKNSWDETRPELLRMLQNIQKNIPVESIKTLSINEARTIILALMEPLAKITSTIQANQGKIERSKNQMIEMLVKNQIEEEYSFVERQLEKPMTVCTTEKCCEIIPIRDGSQEMITIYPNPCHQPCYQPDIPISTIGNEKIKKCEVFPVLIHEKNEKFDYDDQGICSVCECSYKFHQHIKVEHKREIRQKFHKKTTPENAGKIIQVKFDDLANEQTEIYNAVAHFGAFLSKNAILTYNNAFFELLQTEIKKETTARNMNQVKRLQKVLEEYQGKYKMINTSTGAGELLENVISCENVKEIINQLFALPINGRHIRQMYETEKLAQITNANKT